MVADQFGLSSAQVWKATRRGDWPNHLLRPLLAAGKNIITLDQLLTFFEESAKPKQAEAVE